MHLYLYLHSLMHLHPLKWLPLLHRACHPAEQPIEGMAPSSHRAMNPSTLPPSPGNTGNGRYATSAPVALDEVASRGLSGVELQETSEPQLQQLEGEKWVLPATVE